MQSSRHKQTGFPRKRKRGDRGFQEIPLVPVGYQDGFKNRYPEQTRKDKPPPYLNAWRNNLTGLSQRYNLYFVAAEDRLLIFQPTLPDQYVSAEPVVSFTLPVSGPGLRGHMPYANAHSVNNMLVSDLGTEEVVMFACDDGDVIGFWTKDLARCAEARIDSGTDEIVEVPNPFFVRNVRASAWGLAVHSEARLIAASSNTHSVTVWAPALSLCTVPPMHEDVLDRLVGTDPNETVHYGIGLANGEDISLCYAQCTPRKSLSSRRSEGQERNLECHLTNIPSIAFCNVPDDPIGKYLASTDIDGVTIVWDVNRGIPARILVPSSNEPTVPHQYGQSDGWGVLFLDKRSFTPTTSIVNAMGTCSITSRDVTSCGDYPHASLHKRKISICDITHSQSMVKNAGRWTIGEQQNVQSHPNHAISQHANVNSHATSLSSSITNQVQSDTDEEEAEEGNSEGEQSPAGRPNLPSSSDTSPEALFSHRGSETNLMHKTTNKILDPVRAIYRDNLAGKIPREVFPANASMSDPRYCHWPMLTTHSLHTRNVMYQPSKCIPHAKAMPESPLLLINARSLHLFQSGSMLNPPNWENPAKRKDRFRDGTSLEQVGNPDDPGPVIYLDDPLVQDMQPAIRDLLEQHDRLNIYTQIPQLGVVLVGSPKGRVAVITLHQLVPDRGAATLDERANELEEPVYTMRLDHLLPTQEQEENRQRPMQQLVGISASPTFGASGAISKDRWRVLLLYRDHTVLAYELGRLAT